MDELRPDYQAYTLRLARATTSVWRATLYCAQTGQRWHFADPEQLYAFLRQVTAKPAPDPDSRTAQSAS